MSNMWTRFLAGHWCHMILARQRRRTPSGQRCHPNCSDPLQPTAYSCLQPTAYSCLLLEIGRCVGVALPLSAQVRPHLPVVLEPVGRILIGLLACDMWRRYSRPGDDAHKLLCRWVARVAAYFQHGSLLACHTANLRPVPFFIFNSSFVHLP